VIPKLLGAIMDLFSVELGERFTSQAREGWRKLLNYVGGAIIYVKANYAERINTLLASWKICNDASSNEDKFKTLEASDDGSGAAAKTQQETEQKQQKKKGWFGGGGKSDTGHTAAWTTTAGEGAVAFAVAAQAEARDACQRCHRP